MTSAIDIRKIKCLDGLYYSFQLLKHHYSGLYETCCEIPSDNTKLITAISACWGFVDALFRVREIAQSVPNLSHKNPELKAFLTTTDLAEEYRHYIQHLRSELAKNPPNEFPVWGSLSWVDAGKPERSHIAMFGAPLEGTQFTGCVYDSLEKQWVSKVCLGVGQKSFNFDPIFATSAKFEDFIIPFLLTDASEDVKSHQRISIVTFDVNVVSHSGSSAEPDFG